MPDSFDVRWDLDGDGFIDDEGGMLDACAITETPGVRNVAVFAADDQGRETAHVTQLSILNATYARARSSAHSMQARSFVWEVVFVVLGMVVLAGLIPVTLG